MTQLHSEIASQPRSRKARPWLWFTLGAVSGIAITLGGGCIFSAILVAARGANARDRVMHQSTRTEAASFVAIVARPLEVPGAVQPTLSEAQALAGLLQKQQAAVRMIEQGGTVGPIANDFQDALLRLKQVVDHPPSLEPLADAVTSGFRAGINNDDRAFMLALFDGAVAAGKLDAWKNQLNPIHTSIVSCRLRAAQAVMDASPAETPGLKVDGRFVETGVTPGAAFDALVLTNSTGRTLTDVAVVTNLVGNGDAFANVYTVALWPAGQSLVARCRSESPGRETVHNVTRVQYRVLAKEATGPLVELKTR